MRVSRTPILLSGLALALGAVAACGSSGDAEYRLSFANYSSPGAVNAIVAEQWAERVEELTDGRVAVDFYYSEGLLSAEETLAGVSDGRADLAFLSPQYHPSDLPLSQGIGIPFIANNPEASTKALNDIYSESGEFRGEYEDRNNVKVLTFTPLENSILASSTPVGGVDDLAGLSIRTIGFLAETYAAVGADPVALAQGEVYESVQRGVIDASAGTTLDLAIDNSFDEVAKHFVDTGTGMHGPTAYIMNLDLWESLPEDIQSAIDVATGEAVGDYMTTLQERGADACEAALEADVTISTFDDAEVTRFRDMVADGVVERWLSDVESATPGVDAAGFLTDYENRFLDYADTVDYEPALHRCLGQG